VNEAANHQVARAWYGAPIVDFLKAGDDSVLGALARGSGRANTSVDPAQSAAWRTEISILKNQLGGLAGHIFLEFTIPRMGRRIDAVLLIDSVIVLLEFKVGARHFDRAGRDQVWDYALDLKNFHEGSHELPVIPILIATAAEHTDQFSLSFAKDCVAMPLTSTADGLRHVIEWALNIIASVPRDWSEWEAAPYRPTPTIIEAALALYTHHSVESIARFDAGAENLRRTSKRIEELIGQAKGEHKKLICFVTGVPGAGKTLVGLNVATLHRKNEVRDPAVYLSGNGPLVMVLREALIRDELNRRKKAGERTSKVQVGTSVKSFIQNVHHFRDEALHSDGPPCDHVVIFDEAQRAWNLEKTAQFMKQRKGVPDFSQSEAEFLISYLDRHNDWAVIVCLVGGGQEIHTGEAGIGEWLAAASSKFPHWDLYISDRLTDSEYAAGRALEIVRNHRRARLDPNLHLSVSMRSFRAERVSGFVKAVLDCDGPRAKELLAELSDRYPIALTRNLIDAKKWIQTHARGSERYGMVASSKAMRLKPYAIDIRVSVDPVHWFLGDRDDTRSSWYMEDCATEFQVQGLELDWACVTWDGDLRYAKADWSYHDFRGTRWNNINRPDSRSYLKNAYRVLLTRARQGMVIFVPPGDSVDPTRQSAYYDSTFDYLAAIGLKVLQGSGHASG
jgi:Uncharacterized conserved protein (DUF2075)